MTNFDPQLFASIFENSSTILVSTINSAGELIESVSPNIALILAYPSDDIENNPMLFEDLIHNDDLVAYRLTRQQAIVEDDCNELIHSPYRIKHGEGYYIWIKDNVQIIRKDNKIVRFTHILTDISVEMNERDEISRDKSRLEALLHNAGFGIWAWQINLETVECDNNWSHLLGFRKPIKNMKLSRLLALIHPDDFIAFKGMLDNMQSGKTNKADIVIRARHLSGNWQYHSCYASLSRANSNNNSRNNKDSSTIYVSHNNITQQKENELGAISALAIRNQFFARVSHEIRTPLHGILGMLSLVKNEVASTSVQNKIEKITANSEHLLYLLNDILDLAKLNEAKLKISLESVSVSEIINQVQRLFVFKAEEKLLALTTTLPTLHQDIVVTDKVRITQIVSNLVSNAIKYTHTGSVHIYTRIVDECLVLCVQDTGIGIKNTSEIFDAYTQEEAGYAQGTSSSGLGLEIVKKLCDLLGVEIRLTSQKSGTIFELTLGKPMPNSLISMSLARPEISERMRLDGQQILIVDDSDLNREIVMEMLGSVGAICTSASDGYEAVKMIAKDNIYDIVLMDKHMPRMNGIDATMEIRLNRDLNKQPHIIALTADAFDIDNEEWFKKGIDELITKPFDINILIKTISRCIRK